MKKFLTAGYVISLINIGLGCWSLVSIYTGLSYKHNIDGSFSISLSVQDLVPFFIWGVISFAMFLFTKKWIKWNLFLCIPAGFLEDDEREQMITSLACKNSYYALLYAVPILASILAFYPVLQNFVPYLPIILMLLVSVIQMTVYYVSLIRNI